MNYLKNNKNYFLIFSLLFSIALLSRPFLGIKHDGILYFLQSLKLKNPSIFNHDIFFLYGSQDQYTLFSNLYTFFVNLTNAGHATALLELVGLFSWTLAIFFLARSFLSLLPTSIITAMALTLNGYYGSHSVFSYAEPYLTARLYAEMFSIFALGFYLRKRYYLGSVFYLLALSNHPLITLPALFVGVGLVINIRLFLVIILFSLLVGISLGSIEVKPFDGLVQTMDPEWFNYNIIRSPFVFLQNWEWRGFSQLLLTISVAIYAYKFTENKTIKKLSFNLAFMLFIFFTTSYLGASLLKLPLIISLQLHRALWIGLIITLLLLATLIWENRKESNYTFLFSLALTSCLFLDVNLEGIYAILLICVHLTLIKIDPISTPNRLTIIFLYLICAFPLFFHILNMMIDLGEYNFINEKSIITALLSNPIIAIVILTIYYYLINTTSLISKITHVAILLSFFIISSASWYNTKLMDFQESAETYYDSRERQQAVIEIKKLIPESSTVYWINAPRKAWFWLQRANYVSFDQAAGSVFSRATTMELLRRAEHVKNVSDLDSEKSWAVHAKYQRPAVPKSLKKTDFDQLCSDPKLNFVIAEHYDINLHLISFQDPIKKSKFGVYPCLNPLSR